MHVKVFASEGEAGNMYQVTIEKDGKAVAFVLPDGLASEVWDAIPRLVGAAFQRANGEGLADLELAKRIIDAPSGVVRPTCDYCWSGGHCLGCEFWIAGSGIVPHGLCWGDMSYPKPKKKANDACAV